jgi:DNA-binding NarL/FixJ family response regulator
LIEKAGLSEQQSAVIGRRRVGEEIAHIAEELGISENQVSVQTSNAIEKLKKAACQ